MKLKSKILIEKESKNEEQSLRTGKQLRKSRKVNEVKDCLQSFTSERQLMTLKASKYRGNLPVNSQGFLMTLSRPRSFLPTFAKTKLSPESAFEFGVYPKQRIDELYTQESTLGQQSMQRAHLRRFGIKAGHELIRHMMAIMHIASLAPKPFLSAPNVQHKNVLTVSEALSLTA